MSVHHRSRLILGNWKMHKTLEEARVFCKDFLASYSAGNSLIIGLAVPYTLIYPLAQEVKESCLLIGAQNMNDASEGAFTGEIAAKMLIDAGASFVLLGHSERRHIYHETDEWINRKVKRAVQEKLQPILCVGETAAEKNEERTKEVIERQLREGLKDLSAEQLQQLVIAYEPVWAIGTGTHASVDMAEELHVFCRQVLENLYSASFAEKISILYGGSVTVENAVAFLAMENIDGLLIGGASLSLESFLQIVNDSCI